MPIRIHHNEPKMSRKRIAIVSVPLCLFVAGIVLLGHKHARPPATIMASWKRVTITEQVNFLSYENSVKGPAWISFSTPHYVVVNGPYSMGKICPALQAASLPFAHVDVGLLGDAIIGGEKVQKDLLIPAPASGISVADCAGVTAVADHFELRGKTLAVLTKVRFPEASHASD